MKTVFASILAAGVMPYGAHGGMLLEFDLESETTVVPSAADEFQSGDALTAPSDFASVFPCPRLPVAPELDGRRDAVYEQGFHFEGFSRPGTLLPPPEQTRFWLGHTPEAIYIFIEADLSGGREPFAADPKPGGHVWSGEDLEIFVESPNSPGVYYQMAFDPLGNQFMQQSRHRGWKGEWQVRTTRQSDAWAAEVRIPWRDLSIDPAEGTKIRLNIGRTHAAGAAPDQHMGHSSFGVLEYGSFHQTDQFGVMVLGGHPLAVRLNALVDAVASDRRIVVDSAAEANFELRALTSEGLRSTQRINLTAGTQTSVLFSLPLAARRVLSLVTDADGAEIYRSGAFETRLPELVETLIRAERTLDQAEALGGNVRDNKARLAALRGQVDAIWRDVVELPGDLESLLDAEAVAAVDYLNRTAAKAQGRGREDVCVAVVSSMRKVRQGEPLDFEAKPAASLALARGEAESFQVVVLALSDDAPRVTVSASPLRGPGGSELALSVRRADMIRIAGHKANPMLPKRKKGYWPDPLMKEHAGQPVQGAPMSFWITTRASATSPAGEYHGKVLLSFGDGGRMAVPIRASVWDFELGRNLPAAFWLDLERCMQWYGRALTWKEIEQWLELALKYRLDPAMTFGVVGRGYTDYLGFDGGIVIWAAHDGTLRYDFSGMDKYLEFCFARGMREFSITGTCHSTWLFDNLPVFDPATKEKSFWKPSSPEEKDRVVEEFFRVAHEYFSERDWAKYAYLYPADEPKHDQVEAIRRFVAAARRGWPDLRVMIAGTAPQSFAGLHGVVTDWCPLTPAYRPDVAEEFRGRGDRVYWYVACNPPSHRYANILAAQSGVANRMWLWQTWQYRADGILFWAMTQWPVFGNRDYAAVAEDPRSAQGPWNGWPEYPWIDAQSNGDGTLFYPGTDGLPLSSVRLEILRDSIEDWEYFHLLSELAETARARGVEPDIVEKAESLLLIGPEISRSLTEFTRNENILAARRFELGSTIERIKLLIKEKD